MISVPHENLEKKNSKRMIIVNFKNRISISLQVFTNKKNETFILAVLDKHQL
ncbi:hypothetical protein SLEP1_g55883 [Rubroshorea leprosula]|uniref:Uncharacterized protein n=1 Tax=Rubroshorea leprosula TaxID=152421 RepID=A0AAV5MGP9_9ROSI|nr:hypothetical protein SLEP1_g55883 [Rubroshorea leprosula]